MEGLHKARRREGRGAATPSLETCLPTSCNLEALRILSHWVLTEASLHRHG